MTFSEIDLACRGYETRMSRVKEVPRIIAAVLMNVNRRKNSSPIRLEDVIPLYTDKERKVELMTKEEFESFDNLVVKWRNKN
jgi:DNA-binding transcriptional regulator YbjK